MRAAVHLTEHSEMRIFFASDLHGSEVCFRKFLRALDFYEVDVLILGGDLTGKLMIPVISSGSGEYQYASTMGVHRIRDTELEKALQGLANSGEYGIVVDEDEFVRLRDDPDYQRRVFVALMKERLKSWLDLAEKRLRDRGVPIYMMLGNDDMEEVQEGLSSDVVRFCEGEVVTLGNEYDMISVGYANMTPWHAPRDVTEEFLREVIERETGKISSMRNAIFNFHAPPFGSSIDRAPKLDRRLRPVKGGTELVSVGSYSVREAIETRQPLLTLHGHIHESQGVQRIGRTQCFNPGSEYREGILHGVLVSVKGDQVVGYQFTSG